MKDGKQEEPFENMIVVFTNYIQSVSAIRIPLSHFLSVSLQTDFFCNLAHACDGIRNQFRDLHPQH